MERRGRYRGYDGSCPKAMRSSRGRGQGPMKTNHLTENLCFFEMLATVASQLTQGEEKDKGQTQTSPADYKVFKRDACSNAKRAALSNQSTFICHQPDHTDVQNRGTDKTIRMNREAFSEIVTVDKELFLEKEPKHNHTEPCQVKNPYGKKEPQETILPEFEQSTAVLLTDRDFDKPGCCFMGSKGIGGPKQDHELIEEEISRLITRGKTVDLLMQGDMMLDDDNPQSVSSGSSVEAPPSMEQQAYEPLGLHMRRWVGKRKNIYFSKARDDDGNVASTVPTKSSRARRCANNEMKMRVESPRSKRKHHELESKDASIASSPTASSPLNLSDRKLGEPCVKVRIQSFTVPELFVDLPESATVSNLKRSVMEAAINLLGGGFCLRVLLQGKKVLDETASLLQVGISSREKTDLDFMLEPNPLPASTSVEDPLLVLCHAACRPPVGYPILSKGSETNSSSNKRAADKVDVMTEMDGNSEGSQTQAMEMRQAKDDPNLFMHESKIPSTHALVLHEGNELQGLSLVTLGQKSQNMSKRRMRRPYSVAEVEALVQAVEKLGTGRWRDVKLQAFSQAKHRTYVDLKDKWKTLVHTAQISPHQRRGEPVPQGLLDRVINAHSYWTDHQAKQQTDLNLEASFL